MSLIDNRTYFVIENSDRSAQTFIMRIVNFLSTLVNFLLFFMIFKHSKKEKKHSRVVNFLQSLFFYLAQFHFATADVISILPFPAIYCNGYTFLGLNSLWLGCIWIFWFCLFALMMFLVILIRLKAISRAYECFDLKLSTYSLITILITLFIYIPVPYSWLLANQSQDQMRQFVLQYYPNCQKALDIYGILIFTDPKVLQRLIISASLVLVVGGSMYMFFCFAIVYEIRQQGKTMSVKTIKYHLKLLKHILIQNFFRGMFIVTPPIFLFKNAFFDPARDTIIFSIIYNAFFVAAPIPCTIVIFYQNEGYRQFLKSKLMFWKQKPVVKTSKGASDMDNVIRRIVPVK